MSSKSKTETGGNKLIKKPLDTLYLEWAIEHLAASHRAEQCFDKFSNTNTMTIVAAIREAVARLIDTDENYAKAHEILTRIGFYGE